MMLPAARRAGRALAAALAVAATLPILSAPPASAEPPQSRVIAVYDPSRCAGEVCGQDDPSLPQGSTVEGPIQIHVTSQAQFGLEWVRLEAHVEGTPQNMRICLQQWRPPAGTFTFTGHYDWDSRIWPDPATDASDCEHATKHYHTEATKNARYTLRVIARERPPERDLETDSPGFELRLRNVPVAPEWAGDPVVSGGVSPSVTLRWKANPEERTQPSPDIVEYHFVRVGPDDQEREFAVSARDPGAQGCRKLSTLYQCTDTSFTASGEYRYALVAFRNGAGTGGRCATVEGTCAESSLSPVRNASVVITSGAAPVADAPSVTPTASVAPRVSPSASATAPLAVQPPAGRREQLAAAEADDDARAAIPVAAGLALVVAAAHLFRTLRRAR